ncbi:MAG: TonB-dependent receptor [Steroidobacteraceae bacterium]
MKNHGQSAVSAFVVMALGLSGSRATLAANDVRLPSTSLGTAAARKQNQSQQQTQSAPPAVKLQEIVVSGIAADFNKALEEQRTSSVMISAIDSTQLGRFPSADVADALAQLPGVSISRTTGGEGLGVSVDGFGPSSNIVTLDGQELATDNTGRSIAFDLLPAEMITGAQVLQSPQASAMEGSLGGTVNLQTPTAFSYKGFHAVVHVSGQYNDRSRLFGRKYSAFMADANKKRTLGYVLGAVYSDVHQRTDSLTSYSQLSSSSGPSTYPYAGGPGSVPVKASPGSIAFGSTFDTRKRMGLVGNVEWRPAHDLRVEVNGLWTSLDDPQIGYGESYYLGPSHSGSPFENDAVVQNGVINSVSVGNFQPEMINYTLNRKVHTYLYGLNVRWTPTARLSIDTNVYQSVANNPNGGRNSFVTAGLVNNAPVAEDILNITNRPNSLPDINVVLPPGQLGLTSCPAGAASATNPGYCSYTSLMDSGYLNNNKYWSTHYDALNGSSIHDNIIGFTLKGAWKLDKGVFKELEFGADGRKRTKSSADITNDAQTNGSGQYGSLYQTAGCPVQCAPYSFASQGFNVVSLGRLPNFMQGFGGSYPMVLPELNLGQLIGFLQSLNGKPNPLYCTSSPCLGPYTPFNFALSMPVFNPSNSFSVTEKTISGYIEGVFAGRRWSGNIGVRVIHTGTTAATAAAVPVSLYTTAPPGTTSAVTYIVNYPQANSIGANGSYTMALPSLNLQYWVLPNRLQMRVGIAQTMARPDLNQLAPTSTNNAVNGQPSISFNGSAALQPIRENEANLSLSWYYAPGSVLSARVFYKQITNDILNIVEHQVNLGTTKYVGGTPGTVPGTPFLWQVNTVVNGARYVVKGIQANWQAILPDGFGTNMQYTYMPSLPSTADTPPRTFTIGLFFDKPNFPLSADVNWNHQSSYYSECAQCTSIPGWPAISSSFNWVTATLFYRLPYGLELDFKAKNLTNSMSTAYLNGNPLLPYASGISGSRASNVGLYSAFGRTYSLGLTWTFGQG